MINITNLDPNKRRKFVQKYFYLLTWIYVNELRKTFVPCYQ